MPTRPPCTSSARSMKSPTVIGTRMLSPSVSRRTLAMGEEEARRDEAVRRLAPVDGTDPQRRERRRDAAVPDVTVHPDPGRRGVGADTGDRQVPVARVV